METQHADGLVSRSSKHSVDAVVAKLTAMLSAKAIQLFALVDHSGEAERAGFVMRPTKLLIFGNPRAGTPLMLAAPTSAIDLPLKILVWQDASGMTQLTYNAPEYLASRHGIPGELLQNIAAVEALVTAAAQ